MIKKITILGLFLGFFLSFSSVFASDATPRIAYWWGKVNQHVDGNGVWQTDPDGTSGANLDKLTYCKKWYPNTTSVESYQTETITTWKRAIGYEQSDYINTVVTDKCVQGVINPDPVTYINLISPRSGDTLTAGQSVNINWTTNASPSTYVYVGIMDNSNNLIREIRTPNDGQETIIVPYLTPAGQYKIYYQVVYSPSSNGYHMTDFALINVVSPIVIGPTDTTPRVAMWYGKVNQHTDSNGNWKTDPDGVSGAGTYGQWGSEGYGDRKLEYCQKWYPKTTSVEDYKNETINTWREKYNTGGPYTLAVMTTKCVQGGSIENSKVTVLSPNGGEVYQQGTPINISWKGGKNKVQIGLMKSNYNTPNAAGLLGWIELNGTPNSSTVWDGKTLKDLMGNNNQPSATPGQYKIIAVSEDENGNYVIQNSGNQVGFYQGNTDISDNSFTIQSQVKNSCSNNNGTPSLTVLSPNGGEIYQIGQQINVTWKCNLPSKYDKVDILFEAYNDSVTMGYGMDATNPYPTANDGQETITIPKDFFAKYASIYPNALNSWEGKRFTIAVIANDFIPGNGTKAVGDASDGFFTIQSTAPIPLTASNQNSPAILVAPTSVKVLYPDGTDTTTIRVPIKRILKIGSKGDDVKSLQSFLGLKADGKFGKGTASKLKEWQKSKGITADGVFNTMSQAKFNSSN